MLPASVDGFLYPSIDKEKCMQCGKCNDICPERQGRDAAFPIRWNAHQDLQDEMPKKGYFAAKAYAAIARDEEIRSQSTSGGIFALLARKVLSKGGLVAGAAYGGDLYVRHKMARNENELRPLLRSKYLQSDMGSLYRQIGKALSSGREILFCGTPCQVAAIREYASSRSLGENLLLVDLLCRGVPSPKAFHKYLEELEGKHGERVDRVEFKDKSHGWHSLGTRYVFEDGSYVIENGGDSDLAQSFITHDLCVRESCFHCHYKREERISDVTIGDFWGIEGTEMDDDRGTSAVIINTEQGMELFSGILKDIRYKEYRVCDIIRGNQMAFSPLRENREERRLFWKLLDEGRNYGAAVEEALNGHPGWLDTRGKGKE